MERHDPQPAGWYPSPSHLPSRGIERFWSGSRWTDELRIKGKELTIEEYRKRLRAQRTGWALASLALWVFWITAVFLNLNAWILVPVLLSSLAVSFVALFSYFSTSQKLKELKSASIVNAFLAGKKLDGGFQ